MDLVDRISGELGVDRGVAEQGVGALFAAVQLTVDANSFEKLKGRIPQLASWMERSQEGNRTSELMALVGGDAILQNLRGLGYSADQITRLGHLVGEALKASAPADILSTLHDRAPLLGL